MTKPTDKVDEDLLLKPTEALSPGEVVIGQLQGISAVGEPLVDFSRNAAGHAIPAISTLSVNSAHCGRQVALLFTEGNLRQPLIIGFIHSPLQDMLEGFDESVAAGAVESEIDQNDSINRPVDKLEALVDGKRVVIEGEQEIVLKCGEASITLTRAGKIMIRGKYILNRATGVNRILGGSVQVN